MAVKRFITLAPDAGILRIHSKNGLKMDVGCFEKSLPGSCNVKIFATVINFARK
jgi:hypothetical protein